MSQSILIVDDSIPQQKLITSVLANPAWVFFSAYGGVAGISMASSLQPDLILLDVDMNDMNGFEVCRLLKFSAATADIPVIFLTSSASKDEKIHGFDLQAVDYITKPFDPEELCARVRVALRTRHLLSLIPKPAMKATDANEDDAKSFRNPKISMAQLTLARSANPWSRLPPGNGHQEGRAAQ